ncbi:hypothetical protein L1987_70657 [Smallanthus sonchifolius]|uniref:Uncharacterized protein n=1 Tax=Smallanthus sonchifolius TaxID=185202 RepID=A0ACB9AQJ6_9ASTR|nr:hypothetical protein L1987_70657 [Smallanthus sonchifolius]
MLNKAIDHDWKFGMASSNSSTSIFQHDDSAPSEIVKYVPEFNIDSIHVDAPDVHDLRITDVDQQEYVIVGVGLPIGHTPDDHTIPLNTISNTASSSNNSSGQSLHFVGVEERGDISSSLYTTSDDTKCWKPDVSSKYTPVLGMVFDTWNDVTNMYDAYAEKAGFSTRLGTLKKTEDIITHRYMLCTRSGRPKLQDFDSTAYSSNPVSRRRSNFKIQAAKAAAAKEAAYKVAATSGSVFDISAGPSSHPDVELPADPSFCSDVNPSDGPSSRVAVDRSSRYARRFSGHDTDVADITAVPSSQPAVTRSARHTTRV